MQLVDWTLIADHLVSDLSFEVRFVHYDIWVKGDTNPYINAITITFQHECVTSRLAATTVPADVSYRIDANLG